MGDGYPTDPWDKMFHYDKIVQKPRWYDMDGGPAQWRIMKRHLGQPINVTPPVEASSSSSAWVVMARFCYAGSDRVEIPTRIEVAARKNSGPSSPTSYDIQLYCVESASVIGQLLGLTNTVSAIQIVNITGAVPTTHAHFEIQMKRTGGSGGSATFFISNYGWMCFL